MSRDAEDREHMLLFVLIAKVDNASHCVEVQVHSGKIYVEKDKYLIGKEIESIPVHIR